MYRSFPRVVFQRWGRGDNQTLSLPAESLEREEHAQETRLRSFAAERVDFRLGEHGIGVRCDGESPSHAAERGMKWEKVGARSWGYREEDQEKR